MKNMQKTQICQKTMCCNTTSTAYSKALGYRHNCRHKCSRICSWFKFHLCHIKFPQSVIPISYVKVRTNIETSLGIGQNWSISPLHCGWWEYLEFFPCNSHQYLLCPISQCDSATYSSYKWNLSFNFSYSLCMLIAFWKHIWTLMPWQSFTVTILNIHTSVAFCIVGNFRKLLRVDVKEPTLFRTGVCVVDKDLAWTNFGSTEIFHRCRYVPIGLKSSSVSMIHPCVV